MPTINIALFTKKTDSVGAAGRSPENEGMYTLHILTETSRHANTQTENENEGEKGRN